MKLSQNEQRTLARWYLGGVGALRCAEFTASVATIRALFRKGLADKSGLTASGVALGKSLADGGLI